MLARRILTPRAEKSNQKHGTFNQQRKFQLRYTLYLVGAVIFGMVLAGGPTLYFLNHNYQLFINLAYDQSPDLLETLERERLFINGFLLSTSIGVVLFCFLIGFRMTSRIIGPVAVLERHLQKMSRGQWYHPVVKIRQADEFHQLIDAYNYFYLSLQHQVTCDVERLRQLTIDKEHRDARFLWSQMLDEKMQQIDAKTLSSDGVVAQPLGSLRVS
jgi:hypothetical protein